MGEGAVAWKPLSTYPEFASSFASPLPGQSAPAQPGMPPSIPAYTQDPRPTNTFALVGMILGIVSVVTSCCCYGFPFNLLGLIFSILGLTQIKSRHPAEKGKEMAIAGIILSALSILLVVLYVILGFAFNFGDIMKEWKGKF